MPKAAGSATITVTGAGATYYNSISKTYAATVQAGAYYAFGKQTTSSTTNYTTLNKSAFIKLENNKYYGYIIAWNNLYCFVWENFNTAISTASSVFGSSNCQDNRWGGGYYFCSAGTAHIYVYYPSGQMEITSKGDLCNMPGENSWYCR